MNSITLEIPACFIVSQEQFELLATANRDLCLERSPTGELIILPPTGRSTGRRNAKLITYIVRAELYSVSTASPLSRQSAVFL